MTQLVLRSGGFKFLVETHPEAPKTVEDFMNSFPTSKS